jgi:hypothetical protein
MSHIDGIYSSLLNLFGAAVDQGVPFHQMADRIAEQRFLAQPIKTVSDVG